jgi:hypothetical protein
MEWVDIREDMPRHAQIVLVCDAINENISLARFIDQDDEFHFELFSLQPIQDAEVTHWTELPDLPFIAED